MVSNAEQIERLVSRLNAGNIHGAYENLAENCERTSAFATSQAENCSLPRTNGELSSHRRRIDRMVVAGDDVASWFVWSGTVTSTGRSFQCQICNVFHFSDGKVVRWESYGDFGNALAAFAP